MRKGWTDGQTDKYNTGNGTFTHLIYETLKMDAIAVEWGVVGSVRVSQYAVRGGAFVDTVMNRRFHEVQ